MESSPLPVKGANFELCSALIQRGFFYVSHLQGASAYNGHLRWPLTLALIAELLTVELSLPVLTTSVFRSWDMSTQPSLCGANALTHCTTHGKICADTNNMLKYSLVHFFNFFYLWPFFFKIMTLIFRMTIRYVGQSHCFWVFFCIC